VIALIVFGPNRLPEVGRQIGQALRELRKATSEVARSFNGEYEPEGEPYSGYNSSSSTNQIEPYTSNSYTAPPDLTDYTIAGVPVQDTYAYGYSPEAVADAYNVAGAVETQPKAADPSAEETTSAAQQAAVTAVSPTEPVHPTVTAEANTQGEQHV